MGPLILVALHDATGADQSKETRGSNVIERLVADRVDDQELRSVGCKTPEVCRRTLGWGQFGEEIARGGEVGEFTGGDRRVAQRDTQMGLPETGRT